MSKSSKLVAAATMSQALALANATAGVDLALPPLYAGQHTAGLYLANTNALETAHYQQALTEMVIDWSDKSDLAALLDKVAPPVEVMRRFSFKKGKDKEAFLIDTDDERPIGGAFKVVAYSGTEVEAKTVNRGLTLVVDKDEEPTGAFNIEKRTRMLMQRLQRSELKRAFTAWATGTNEDQVWSSSTDPDADLLGMVNTSRTAGGIHPNILIMDAGTWALRFAALSASTAPGAGSRSLWTPQQLADWLQIPTVHIVKEVYQAGSSKAVVSTANTAYVGYVDGMLSKDDPSNIKSFYTNCAQGGRFAVYQEDLPKLVKLTVEHYSNTYVTNSVGMRKMTVSAS
jgi:hypothetical protein